MSSSFFLPIDRASDALPLGMLSDPIDFATGELLSIGRSYDPTDAAVFSALRTVRGSGSAVEDVGQKLHEHPLVDAGLAVFVRQEVAFALKHLTDAAQIRIVAVDVITERDSADIAIRYENLALQRERTARARISELVR